MDAEDAVIPETVTPEGVPHETLGATQPNEVSNPAREAVMAAFMRDA